jgi:cbb3-type cytochrome oxidase subunit 3
MEDFFAQAWVQGLLVLMLIGLGVWWFKFRPES